MLGICEDCSYLYDCDDVKDNTLDCGDYKYDKCLDCNQEACVECIDFNHFDYCDGAVNG